MLRLHDLAMKTPILPFLYQSRWQSSTLH